MPRVNSSRRGLAGWIAGLKRSGNCAPTSLASGGLERIPAPRLGDASRKGERAVWGTSAPDITGSSSTGGSRFLRTCFSSRLPGARKRALASRIDKDGRTAFAWHRQPAYLWATVSAWASAAARISSPNTSTTEPPLRSPRSIANVVGGASRAQRTGQSATRTGACRIRCRRRRRSPRWLRCSHFSSLTCHLRVEVAAGQFRSPSDTWRAGAAPSTPQHMRRTPGQ